MDAGIVSIVQWHASLRQVNCRSAPLLQAAACAVIQHTVGKLVVIDCWLCWLLQPLLQMASVAFPDVERVHFAFIVAALQIANGAGSNAAAACMHFACSLGPECMA